MKRKRIEKLGRLPTVWNNNIENFECRAPSHPWAYFIPTAEQFYSYWGFTEEETGLRSRPACLSPLAPNDRTRTRSWGLSLRLLTSLYFTPGSQWSGRSWRAWVSSLPPGAMAPWSVQGEYDCSRTFMGHSNQPMATRWRDFPL